MTTEISHLHTVIPSPSFPSLFLRTIKASDVERFVAILSAPSNKSDPHSQNMTLHAAEAAIARSLESASEPTIVDAEGNVIRGPDRVNMMLVLRSENGSDDEERIIGLGGFGAIKSPKRDGRRIRVGDAGVMLDPAYKRLGYGLEAMKMAIRWAFTPASEGGPQLDLVSITMLEDNDLMLKLVNEKLGLEGRGVTRESEFDEDKLEVYYELTKEDWENINRN
jgi:RimJ/RimL family protein N-acetyltransferase